MKMTELKKKAAALGIRPGNTRKAELIRAIQQAEGNAVCFGQSDGHCAETVCCFLTDCVKVQDLALC